MATDHQDIHIVVEQQQFESVPAGRKGPIFQNGGGKDMEAEGSGKNTGHFGKKEKMKINSKISAKKK